MGITPLTPLLHYSTPNIDTVENEEIYNILVWHMQSTLALRTPHYYGHTDNKDSGLIPDKNRVQTFDWNTCKFPLLRTLTVKSANLQFEGVRTKESWLYMYLYIATFTQSISEYYMYLS